MIRTRWGWFVLLLTALYVVRGCLFACILPPGSAWDEYQHLAYFQYFQENHHAPVYGEATVPPSVAAAAAWFPQPNDAATELESFGAKPYQDYWKAYPFVPQALAHPVSAGLYEAQHPLLYYALLSPLYAATGGVRHLAATTAALRLANVAMTAIALASFLWLLGRCCRRTSDAMVIGLWATLQPLFLINAARVANDALAIMVATLAVVWAAAVAMPGARKRWPLLLHAAALGLLLGCGILVKAIDVAAVPVVGICLMYAAVRYGARWRQAWGSAAVVMLVVLCVIGHYVLFNLRHFGLPFPLAESVMLHQQHLTLRQELALVPPPRHWVKLFIYWIFTWGLWIGGWQFPQPRFSVQMMHALCLVIAALGYPLAALLRRRQSISTDGSVFKHHFLPLAMLLTIVVLSEMCMHMIQASVCYGTPAISPPWYLSLAIPWMMAVFAAGALQWRRTPLSYAVAFSIPLIFVFTELVYSVLKLPRIVVLLPFGPAGLHRLAMFQPGFMGTPTLLTCLLATVILECVAFAWSIRSCIQQDRSADAAHQPAAAAEARGLKG